MKSMDTPVTAWRNGLVLEQFVNVASDVENYRAVYCKVYDWPDKAARFMKCGFPIDMAVEDALYDKEFEL